MIKFLRNNIEYVAVFILIYFNFDSALSSCPLIPFQPIMFVLQGLMAVYLFNKPKHTSVDGGLLVLLALSILIVGFVHNFNSLTYIYRLFLIVLCYQMVVKLDFQKVQLAYCKIMFFFAFASIIFYTLLNTTGSAGPFLTYYTDTAHYGTNFVYSYLSSWIIRNESIFREPGVLQIYANMALLFYYNLNKSVVIDRYVIVYMTAIFLSLSTAGTLICGFLIGFRYLQNSNKSISTNITFFVIAVIAYLGVQTMFDQIFGKLVSGTEESGSAFARYYSIFIPMQIAFDHPISGCGALEFNSIIDHYAVNGRTLSVYEITNTLTTNFATSGLFVGILGIVGFCKGVLFSIRNLKHKWIYVILALAMFSNENCLYSVLFNYLLILGLTSNARNRVTSDIITYNN